jgi:toxin YoeB
VSCKVVRDCVCIGDENDVFHAQAWEDYLYWQANNRKWLERINGLLKECARTPFQGTGKPERLRGDLSGWWSRRINQAQRLIYRPSEDGVLVAQRRYHY